MNCPECKEPILKERINGMFYWCACGHTDDTTWSMLQEYLGVQER